MTLMDEGSPARRRTPEDDQIAENQKCTKTFVES